MIQFSKHLIIDRFHFKKTAKGPAARVYVFGSLDEKRSQKLVGDLIARLAADWQKESLAKKTKEVTHFSSADGPIWIIARKRAKTKADHQGRLSESDYAWYREQVGAVLAFCRSYEVSRAQFFWRQTNKEQELGALVGLNLAAYQYKTHNAKDSLLVFPQVFHDKLWSASDLKEVRARSWAINLSRHLVNCPPNEKNPKTYAQFVQNFFKDKKHLKCEIWNSTRLKKEKMGLHLGVGQGAAEAPCLIHLSYRPTTKVKAKTKLKPVVFVGKGITFDSGGLDIKPSSGMRLMKKDMGGSAAVLGLAVWAIESGYHGPLDFYIGLAENSVDAHSMRPSDVLTSRNGMKVEIHNTDAEGRLVLADVLDVAVTQKEEPEVVIDVATLTGAIKIALGAEIAGLFSNDDKLAEDISKAGAKGGDLNWRMPLMQKYTGNMSTPFADIVNAVDGFGGAITAALFLENFVRGKKWAHLDIYAWNDKAGGSLAFSGGNGQGVQCLIEWLNLRK
jgi:leucyl aminopeptidase